VTDATAVEERDEAVVEAITAGRSLRSVRREFGLTVTELDQALERCFPLDVAARMRMIRGDLAKLDRLIDEFYQRALKEHDPHLAMVAIKAWERKHDITGAGAAQRIDLTVQPKEHATSYEKLTATIMSFTGRNGRNSNAGAVDALSPPDGNGSGGPAASDGDKAQ
jgi:phage baseplate assembly protein W